MAKRQTPQSKGTRRAAHTALLMLALGTVNHRSRAAELAWCADEFAEVVPYVCSTVRRDTPPDAAIDTLVVFLHGVIKPDTGWQYQQQRAIARTARVHHFDVIMPRGRQGVGPKGMEDWWTWPTAAVHQQRVEPELLSEWQTARGALEAARGKPYRFVFVFGFSNGAYYATQLALRGQLPGNGAAIFSGGASGDWLERHARQTTRRPPIHVDCGTADKTAIGDARRLNRLLRKVSWPHEFVERKGVGHTMTDAGVERAIEYLRKPSR